MTQAQQSQAKSFSSDEVVERTAEYFGGRKEPVPIITGRMDEGGIRRDDMALLLGQRV
jgi:hypothetical protein